MDLSAEYQNFQNGYHILSEAVADRQLPAILLTCAWTGILGILVLSCLVQGIRRLFIVPRETLSIHIDSLPVLGWELGAFAAWHVPPFIAHTLSASGAAAPGESFAALLLGGGHEGLVDQPWTTARSALIHDVFGRMIK